MASAVGEVGSTPNEVLAWRMIFESPNRDEIFQDIVATGSLSGRLYALAGLWFADESRFEAAFQALSARGGTVQTVSGCLVSTQPLVEVLREIRTGSWSTDFRSGGRYVMVR